LSKVLRLLRRSVAVIPRILTPTPSAFHIYGPQIAEKAEAHMHEVTPIHVSPEEIDRYTKLPFREQYAILMALGEPEEYDERYQNAYEDFIELVRVPRLTTVGINWQFAELVLGTEGVSALGSDDELRDLGDLVFMIRQRPADYHVKNIRLRMKLAFGDDLYAAHPHARDGQRFCMANMEQAVLTAIADGRCSQAARILVTAAWMKKGSVATGVPYSGAQIDNWPIKQTEE
jgi:hypothetical protein